MSMVACAVFFFAFHLCEDTRGGAGTQMEIVRPSGCCSMKLNTIMCVSR